MLKNNKGVTLTMLVITIIIVVILAGTAITASDLLIKQTKAKNVTTNMILVKAKAEALYEEYTFNNISENSYVGTKVTDVSNYGEENTGKWYKWGTSELTSLGFDENMLANGGEFIVNYETGEVIYTLGVTDDSGAVKYTLSELKN